MPPGLGPRATPLPPCLSRLCAALWSPTRVSEEPCPRGPSENLRLAPSERPEGELRCKFTRAPTPPTGRPSEERAGGSWPGQGHPPSPLPRGRPGCKEMEDGPGGPWGPAEAHLSPTHSGDASLPDGHRAARRPQSISRLHRWESGWGSGGNGALVGYARPLHVSPNTQMRAVADGLVPRSAGCEVERKGH